MIFVVGFLRAGVDATQIWVWVIVGIALGAGLHGYVPEGFVAAHLGGGEWWSVPLAVAIGMPTYANVTSVIPVTSELINQGLPVGTAFAFMLCGWTLNAIFN